MLLTPHVLTAMFFGGSTSSAALAPFASIFSFFFVEMIPHWDPAENKTKFYVIVKYLDFFLSGLSIFIITWLKEFNFVYLLSGVTAVLLYIFFQKGAQWEKLPNILKKLIAFRAKVTYVDRSFWGAIVQVALCILSISLIFALIDFPTWERIKRNLFFGTKI